MSATALSRLNHVSQFRIQRIVAGKSKNFFSNSVGSSRFLQAMSASGSLPVFGDLCFDDLVTTCSNGLDFYKKRSTVGSFTVNIPIANTKIGKREGMTKNRLVFVDPLKSHGSEVTAQKIAELALQRAFHKKRQSPFAAAAQEAGFRFYGGKLDDITVVVSYVT